ncbi:MAG: hypothetical protein NDJ89_04125 [Oligoflexia bacterium]|nr:hypothetical protein [Oligoflexia bacterium]
MKTARIPSARTAALLLISLVACARLVQAGWIDSMDFTVYWKAAQAWVSGGASPYEFAAADRGFVFKYPPYLLPALLPLGVLDFGAAKLLWCAVELGCLAYAFRWLLRAGVGFGAAVITTFLFWWIWLGHFYAGQLTIVLLAAALWAVPADGASEPKPARLAALALIFSAKVFSLTSLAGLSRWLARPRVAGAGLALFLALNAVLLARAGGSPGELAALYGEWVRAALSGGAELGQEIVRGQMNHGFTAGVLRWSGVTATSAGADLGVALFLAASFGLLWTLGSRGLAPRERWLGWLGVGLITHPLAWHHSFVLVYPLCAVSLDRALRSGLRGLVALSLGGIACIGLVIPNIIGLALVTPLENLSVKSWGVCLAALSLVLAERARPRARGPATPAPRG